MEEIMSIHETALLVAYHNGRWGVRKQEKQESRKIEANKNAEHGVFSVSKSLMAGSAMKTINAAHSKAKATHVLLTSPWDRNGTGIIACKAYAEYARLMQECKHSFNAAVQAFCHDDLEELILAEQVRQGDSFNRDDYPDADDIFSRFSFEVDVNELPRAKDIRVDVSNAERKAIASNIERRNNERIETAVKSIFKRIADVTEKMHKSLSEYKKKDSDGKGSGFQDSLVSNVLEVANILPDLNITNDKRITELHKQLTDELCGNAAIMLKSKDDLRNDTARKAKKIFDKVSQYM